MLKFSDKTKVRNQERLQGCCALAVVGGTDEKRKELGRMTVQEFLMIWFPIIVSASAFCFSIYMGLKGNRKNEKSELEERAAEMARLNVKLDAISKNLQDVKDELRLSRQELQNLSERVAKVEASASQAHKRLDDHMRKHEERE